MPEVLAPILEVDHLSVAARSLERDIPLVDSISFSLEAGSMLALVGESGCGKSMTALSMLGLLPKSQMRVTGGGIRLAGENLLTAGEQRMRSVRGNEMAMVFQEPSSSLNPVLTIGEQLVEAVLAHREVTRSEAREIAAGLLERVKLAEPGHVLATYPHRLSGGMCQRVMIAMALCGDPKVLIADEPTTALDVTVQAQILELIAELQRDNDMAVLLITHDLGLVAGYADKVAVMYAGRIIEIAPVDSVFYGPMHPYTASLLQAAPRFDERPGGSPRFREIRGQVPSPGTLPKGCSFAPRCDRVSDICIGTRPDLFEADGHRFACYFGGTA